MMRISVALYSMLRGRKGPCHWPAPDVWGRDGRSDSMDGIGLLL